jgi:L-threonylcarbamoyladenylate synthase
VNRESIQKVIQQAISVLDKGGVILYPADTIWGIGCDAMQPAAIRRVYEIKGRSYAKPLILLVADFDQLYRVVSGVHPRVDTLLQLHERPLTVIYPQTSEPFCHLAAVDGSIAVRIVKSGFCHELLTEFGGPLVSTSANQAGIPSPSDFGSISSDMIREVDYTLPAFTERGITGNPSVIARYDDNGELDFIR